MKPETGRLAKMGGFAPKSGGKRRGGSDGWFLPVLKMGSLVDSTDAGPGGGGWNSYNCMSNFVIRMGNDE